jgi:hypothetical protein
VKKILKAAVAVAVLLAGAYAGHVYYYSPEVVTLEGGVVKLYKQACKNKEILGFAEFLEMMGMPVDSKKMKQGIAYPTGQESFNFCYSDANEDEFFVVDENGGMGLLPKK